MNNNKNIKNFFSVFVPSGVSLVLSMFLAGVVIALHQVKEIQQYLQLPKDFQLLPLILKWLNGVLVGLIGESTTQVVVVGLFWAVVGLGVYVFLQGVARFALELTDSLGQRKYYWPQGSNRNQPLLEVFKRTVFRIVAFLIFLFVLFGPLTRTLSGLVWVDFIGPNTWIQIIVWFVALVALMHLCIVLIRLVALKPRLLG